MVVGMSNWVPPKPISTVVSSLLKQKGLDSNLSQKGKDFKLRNDSQLLFERDKLHLTKSFGLLCSRRLLCEVPKQLELPYGWLNQQQTLIYFPRFDRI